jgi:hypothetical protein
MKKKNIVSHTAFLGLLACVIAIGLAMAGSAGIFGGSAGRIFAADINWSVDGDGTVRDSSGKAIKGTKIQLDHKNPALQSAAVTSKKNAAKTVIAEAVRSGLIQDPGVSPDDMTLEEILAIPTFQQLDFDRDGITNAEEIRLGTDPYVADTDRDGQSDGVEIQSGHDPKIFSPGDSRDTVVREDVKSVIASENAAVASQENPLPSKKKDDRYRVESVSLVKAGGANAGESVHFAGKALPNTFVTLYIYSTPTIVTIRADANGDWSYDLSSDLENGDHEAYVAVTDSTGKISSYGSGIAFTKTAEAITVRPIAEASQGIPGNQSPLERSRTEYFFAAFIAILFFSGVALLVVNRRAVK